MSDPFTLSPSGHANPPRGAWSGQGRVLKALILRELQIRHGRNNIGYLWALAEPLMLMITFVALFYYFGQHANDRLNPVAFLATGIITFTAMRSMASGLANAPYGARSLLLYPQVTPLDVIVSRWIVHSVTMLGVFFLIIAGAWFFNVAPLPHDYMGVLVALAMMAIMGLSLGMLQYALITLFPIVDHIIAPVWRLLFFTSCVFYTMDSLPYSLQQIVYYNPIAHGIEMLRHAYFYGFQSPVTNYYYMGIWCGLSLFAGLLVERLYRYKEPRE